MSDGIEIRLLSPEDAIRIGEIDRSEHITLAYRYGDGQLREEMFRLTDHPDPELFALEPEDIHMVKAL